MAQPRDTRSSIKETVTSVVIAFVLAFVFRGFVIEAFQIPTGSMAPTLMGQHVRFTGPETGVSWPVGPRDFVDGTMQQQAMPIQGNNQPLAVTDPMLRGEAPIMARDVPTRAGDRIFVLKYLYSVFDPARFDVVVFKNPSDPQQNFIKRLLGLPSEQIALVHGDLFTRPAADAAAEPGNPAAAWEGASWKIQRKPERVQRVAFQTVFDSARTPYGAAVGRRQFRSPWLPGSPQGWDLSKPTYAYSGAGPTTLEWDAQRRPIDDYYPYNELAPRQQGSSGQILYRVPDVSVSFALLADDAPPFGVVVDATSHRFAARVDPAGKVSITMQPLPVGEGEEAPAREIGAGSFSRVPGRPLDVEVWHADQAVTVWIDGRRVASGAYDWTPAQRIAFATGIPLAELLDESARSGVNQLALPQRYRAASARIELGGPARLDRVALARDLYWTPGGQTDPLNPARSTHPAAPVVLGPDQYFTCGDNSPASDDGRLWRTTDSWVAHEIDPTVGVVARPLLIGKAFFVYFPSADWSRRIPVPDFGRMRWIW